MASASSCWEIRSRALSTLMLFFMAGFLPVSVKSETEDCDIKEEREDDAVEHSVALQEGVYPVYFECLADVHGHGRYYHQDEANPRSIRNGTQTEGLDEFIFLLFFGKADEQGGQGCRDIKDQHSELAVVLRNQLEPVENQKEQSQEDGACDQQRPADALEGMRKEVSNLVHFFCFCKCNAYFT